MYSDAIGDVPPGSIGGLVHADTRLLSTWVLTINGARLLPLRSGSVEHYSAAFFLTNPELPGLPANEFGVRRLRSVGQPAARADRGVVLRPGAGADRAAAVGRRPTSPTCSRSRTWSGTGRRRSTRSHAADGSALVFTYRNDDFSAQTRVEVSPPADRIEGDDLVWELELADDATWSVDITVPLDIGPERGGAGPQRLRRGRRRPDRRRDRPLVRRDAGAAQRLGPAAPHRASRPRGTCSRCGSQTSSTGASVVLPAAGLPWFLTVFGRDTLITAYQTVSFGPQLARGALLALASLQGKESRRLQGRGARQDPARDPAGRADPARAEAAQPVLRHGRRDHALADPALRVLALDRRRRAGPAARGPTRWPRWTGSTSTATATATATSSTRPAPRRAWATSAGATRGTACSSPTGGSRTCRSRPASCRATSTTRSCGWPSWPTGRWPTPTLAAPAARRGRRR